MIVEEDIAHIVGIAPREIKSPLFNGLLRFPTQ
jgi:hypothetical protein